MAHFSMTQPYSGFAQEFFIATYGQSLFKTFSCTATATVTLPSFTATGTETVTTDFRAKTPGIGVSDRFRARNGGEVIAPL